MTIRPCEISDPNVRKRYSDFKFIFNFLQFAAEGNGSWVRTPTVLQVNEMFLPNESALNLPLVTSKNRERRIGQLKWTSAVKEIRNLNRTAAAVE
jgi:hypothetical protein